MTKLSAFDLHESCMSSCRPTARKDAEENGHDEADNNPRGHDPIGNVHNTFSEIRLATAQRKEETLSLSSERMISTED